MAAAKLAKGPAPTALPTGKTAAKAVGDRRTSSARPLYSAAISDSGAVNSSACASGMTTVHAAVSPSTGSRRVSTQASPLRSSKTAGKSSAEIVGSARMATRASKPIRRKAGST